MIGTEVYYPVPMHLQKCFADLGYKQGDFPVSEACADDSLALPVYPELPEDDLAYVCQMHLAVLCLSGSQPERDAIPLDRGRQAAIRKSGRHVPRHRRPSRYFP